MSSIVNVLTNHCTYPPSLLTELRRVIRPLAEYKTRVFAREFDKNPEGSVLALYSDRVCSTGVIPNKLWSWQLSWFECGGILRKWRFPVKEPVHDSSTGQKDPLHYVK
jgi:hypothetical protein